MFGSDHVWLCQVPDVEESDQFVVAGREHDAVVAPISVEDHASRALLRDFEALDYLLILQRPDYKLIL